MPKVLHVITGLSVGGAELMLARLLARMDQSRLPSAVVSLTTGPQPGACNGTPVYSLGMRPGLPDPRGLVALGRIMAQERPDVVQTWLYHADLVGLLAAKWKSTAAVAWNLRCAALTVQESSRAVVALRTVLARLSSFPDVVVANSDAGRMAHEAYGYHPRRWAVIPNGFDTSVLQPDEATRGRVRAALGVGPTTAVIGLVARLHPIKDHGTFFAASAELVKTYPDVVFVLAGLGLESGNPTVRAFFDRFGLDPAHYRLRGSQDQIDQLLPACDICTLTSTSEGFPNALGEAMATGIPCVATDAGDCRRLVGDTGRVVPVREPRALADAWRSVLMLEPVERARLGARARQRIIETFSLDRIVAQYVALYEDLAASARQRRA
jgi:glycosyltransferase involved in cell wall biosynthesis